MIHRLINEPPAPIRSFNSSIPADIEFITDKCLSKDPNDRYQTARDLSDDLRRFQEGEPIRAKASGVFERTLKFARRKPFFVGAATIIVTLLAFSSGALLRISSVTEQRNRAQAAELRNETLLADTSLDAGRLAMQRGQMTAAVKHFRIGLAKRFPSEKNVDSFLALGECYLALGQSMTTGRAGGMRKAPKRGWR